MKGSIPSKTEQIEALMRGTAYELTMKYAGRDKSGSPQYSKVFNITRKAVEEYLREHYLLDSLPFTHSSPGSNDGIYIIPVIEGYFVYYQERGIRNPEYLVPSENDAWKFYVDFRLRASGTGLRWE